MGLTQNTLSTATDFQAITLKYLSLIAAGNGSLENLRKVADAIQKNPDYLAAALSQMPPLPTDGTPYGRKVIFESELGDAMIARWPANLRCLPHDHGGAHGVVTVLRGSFFEQDYAQSGEFRTLGAEQAFRTGEFRMIEPTEIHSLRAECEGITLHLYAPPVRGMKVYDEANRIIYTVSGTCGAWIPADKSLIQHREKFPSTDSLHH